MENFNKQQYELVNGTLFTNQLMPRSLVVFNDKGVMYNIAAKVRNTDMYTVIRSLAKAVLVSMREANKKNSTEAAQKSKKKVTNKVTPALSCYLVGVTDKFGNVLTDSLISAKANGNADGKLRDFIKFTKAMPIYKLVVEQGLDWADESVACELKHWVTATIEQMDYISNLDAALGRAADSNATEYAQALKAEREALKAEREASKLVENVSQETSDAEREEVMQEAKTRSRRGRKAKQAA